MSSSNSNSEKLYDLADLCLSERTWSRQDRRQPRRFHSSPRVQTSQAPSHSPPVYPTSQTPSSMQSMAVPPSHSPLPLSTPLFSQFTEIQATRSVDREDSTPPLPQPVETSQPPSPMKSMALPLSFSPGSCSTPLFSKFTKFPAPRVLGKEPSSPPLPPPVATCQPPSPVKSMAMPLRFSPLSGSTQLFPQFTGIQTTIVVEREHSSPPLLSLKECTPPKKNKESEKPKFGGRSGSKQLKLKSKTVETGDEQDLKEGQWSSRLRPRKPKVEEKAPKPEKEKFPVINLTLTKEEIRSDFIKMTGKEPPKKLKKRTNINKREQDKLFPGTALAKRDLHYYSPQQPKD